MQSYGIKKYWKKIYDARYFWTYFAKIDLKNKFRKSKLGVLWLCVSPLCLMGIMVLVFGTAFNYDYGEYSPYILSGLLFWNIVSESFVGGANCIIGSVAYIKQFDHPIAIYPLKASITSIVSFTISLLALVIMIVFISPYNLLVAVITLIPTLLIYFLFSWFGGIISGYEGTKYRDYPQLAALALQAIWYVSPVFFMESQFKEDSFMRTFFFYNPNTHLLNLIRKPFLEGHVPDIADYLFSLGFVMLLGIIAYLLNKKNEKNIVFYI